jgi:nucleoside-diphosphate-sugar epimerase
MKILITGGLGFIATHLVPELEKSNEVYTFDRERAVKPNYIRGDINDYYSLMKAFSAINPDVVIHLAAMVSRKECEETPNLAIATNVTGTHNVCTLSLKSKARLIYSGSSEEYGTAFNSGKIVDENTPFGEPTSIYSMTKRMAEELVQYYSFFKQLQATTMRIFMLYGPRENPNEYRSALVRFAFSALNNQPLIVHRNTERSWCYIHDAVEAIRLILKRKQETSYEVFNIGKDEPIATEDLAKKIVDICGSKSEIKMVPPDPTIIPIKRGSFEKAKRVLGWDAKVPLDQGLEKVRDYLLNREA